MRRNVFLAMAATEINQRNAPIKGNYGFVNLILFENFYAYHHD